MAEQDGPAVALGEAARRLGVTTDALRMRFRRGKIKGFRRDGRIFVWLPADVDPAGEQSEQGTPARALADAAIERLETENARLQEQQDRLLTLLEREQVLRQQFQTQVADLSGKMTLAPPSPDIADLEARLSATESNFDLLKKAVSQLVRVVEGRG